MLKNIQEKGVSLYLALVITATLLAIALGLNTIFLGQTKTIQSMGYSVVAFYAADAGIERVLLDWNNPACPAAPPLTTLSNGATYQVTVTASGVGSCTAPNCCIKSVGEYYVKQTTRRAIEITY